MKHEIVNYLNKKVQNESTVAHSPLPSETRLSIKFNCSRLTARSALKDLEAYGLIYSIKGRGYFVESKDKNSFYGSLTERYDITDTKTIKCEPLKLTKNLTRSDITDMTFLKKTYKKEGRYIIISYLWVNTSEIPLSVASINKSLIGHIKNQGIHIKRNIKTATISSALPLNDLLELGYLSVDNVPVIIDENYDSEHILLSYAINVVRPENFSMTRIQKIM